MARGDLTDAEWERLEPLLPPQEERRRGNRYKDHRTVVNGMLWVLRTGAPWRDMPERYGKWRTVYSRFRRWTERGVWQKALESLQGQADARGGIDWDATALDGSYVKAHPHAAGAPKRGALRRRVGRARPSGSVEVD